MITTENPGKSVYMNSTMDSDRCDHGCCAHDFTGRP